MELAAKVAFLRSPSAYPFTVEKVIATETHMSWVFLTGRLVYKLKKPVRFPFLDMTSLEARKVLCEDEIRLNRRLAEDVYRRVVPLSATLDGGLALDGGGEPVDWLVEMKQLPASAMLDAQIRSGTVRTDEIKLVGEALGGFYEAAPSLVAEGKAYPDFLLEETRTNASLLTSTRFALPQDRVKPALTRVHLALEKALPLIEQRVALGKIVEGHGDLRPEHIALGSLPRIIDCLEFNRRMRILDPYDEISYLGMECRMLGADWIGPLLIQTVDKFVGPRPPADLLHTYAAFRAATRARICIAHLLDEEPATPTRWPREALAYLAIAEAAALMAPG